jgi:hypothetical protein
MLLTQEAKLEPQFWNGDYRPFLDHTKTCIFMKFCHKFYDSTTNSLQQKWFKQPISNEHNTV